MPTKTSYGTPPDALDLAAKSGNGAKKFWEWCSDHDRLLLSAGVLLAISVPVVSVAFTDVLGFTAATTVGEVIVAIAAGLSLVAVVAIAFGANKSASAQIDIATLQAEHALAATTKEGLADLTTGDVSRARDVVGTFIYDERGAELVDWDDLIASYFQLGWALERSSAALYALGVSETNQRSAAGAWAWHLEEIAWNVWLIGAAADEAAAGIDDGDARNRLGVILANMQLPRGDIAPSCRWVHVSTPKSWETAAAWSVCSVSELERELPAKLRRVRARFAGRSRAGAQ